MANGTKYWGSINLSEIKAAIESGILPFEGKKGKYLPVDVWVTEEPDQFGNSCSISCYNKNTKQATYLGNLKKSGPFANEAPADKPDTDLPF